MIQVQTKPNALYAVIFVPTYKKQLGFAGYVRSFSSVDERGAYDILPGHENFVTVAQGNAVIFDEAGKRYDFTLGKAVVEVSENVLKVFVDF